MVDRRREWIAAGMAGLVFAGLLALSGCGQMATAQAVDAGLQPATGQALAQQATPGEQGRLATRQAVLATQEALLATDQARATAQSLATRQAVGAEQTAVARVTATEAAYQRTATAYALEVEASVTVAGVAIEATAEEVAFRRTATAQARALELTATEQAHRRTATAAALAVQGTATEQTHRRTATVQAAERETTRTALALSAAQTATAEVAARRQQVVQYGVGGAAVIVGLGLVVLLVLALRSLPSISVLWLRLQGREEEPPAERCPPVVIQPGGAVEVPLLTQAEADACAVSRDQMVEILNWATQVRGEAGTRAARPGPPSAPGLRSIHTLRRLDQAVKAGVLSASFAARLEDDWERETIGE